MLILINKTFFYLVSKKVIINCNLVIISYSKLYTAISQYEIIMNTWYEHLAWHVQFLIKYAKEIGCMCTSVMVICHIVQHLVLLAISQYRICVNLVYLNQVLVIFPTCDVQSIYAFSIISNISSFTFSCMLC